MTKRSSGGAARTAAVRPPRDAQARPPRANEWTGEKRETFLATLAQTLNVTASARAAEMSPASARMLKRRDAGFAEAWEEAMIAAYEELELALIRRATKGVSKPVWHQGKRVGRERVFSESMALQLMAQHRTTVMELRARRGIGAAHDEADEAIRARLILRIETMRENLTGQQMPVGQQRQTGEAEESGDGAQRPAG